MKPSRLTPEDRRQLLYLAKRAPDLTPDEKQKLLDEIVPTFAQWLAKHQARTGLDHAQLADLLEVRQRDLRIWLEGSEEPEIRKRIWVMQKISAYTR